MARKTIYCSHCNAVFSAAMSSRKIVCDPCVDSARYARRRARLRDRSAGHEPCSPLLLLKCRDCRQEKIAANFSVCRQNATGRRSECRECAAINRGAKKLRPQRDYKAERASQKAAAYNQELALIRKLESEQKAHRLFEDKVIRDFNKRVAQVEQRRLAREEARRVLIADKPWFDLSLPYAERYRLRYRNDPEFNLSERVRSRMRSVKHRNIAYLMRKAAIDKSRTFWEVFLGYSAQELKLHLQSKFSDGMNWEAFCRGEIHIDHIKPACLFDLMSDEGLRQCWALDNLQPLWGEDNISKGARYEEAA